jgi:hypothetical protein
MKARYSLPLVAMGLELCAQAQTSPVTVRNGTEVVNGTTIQVNAEVTDSAQLMGMALQAENTSGVERLINVKRYEINVLHGTQNYFCWDLCYGAQNAGAMPTWIGADPIPMAAGSFANGFHAYYKPMTLAGTSTFRYVWYDMDSPNDSTWVDFVFNATAPAGIAELGAVRGFKAYPNPSVDGGMTFDYDLSAATPDTRLALYNVLGERKLVKAVGAAQGRIILPEGELSSGVWFAVLERNGKPLATKRVAVVR